MLLLLSPVTCAGRKHRDMATLVWQSAFQTENKVIAWLPRLAFPELEAGPRSSCSSECWVAEPIICNPENWYYRNVFSLSHRYTL